MKKEALEAFGRCRQAGCHNAGWATEDPDLGILHDDPEFLRLVSAVTRRAF